MLDVVARTTPTLLLLLLLLLQSTARLFVVAVLHFLCCCLACSVLLPSNTAVICSDHLHNALPQASSSAVPSPLSALPHLSAAISASGTVIGLVCSGTTDIDLSVRVCLAHFLCRDGCHLPPHSPQLQIVRRHAQAWTTHSLHRSHRTQWSRSALQNTHPPPSSRISHTDTACDGR